MVFSNEINFTRIFLSIYAHKQPTKESGVIINLSHIFVVMLFSRVQYFFFVIDYPTIEMDEDVDYFPWWKEEKKTNFFLILGCQYTRIEFEYSSIRDQCVCREWCTTFISKFFVFWRFLHFPVTLTMTITLIIFVLSKKKQTKKNVGFVFFSLMISLNGKKISCIHRIYHFVVLVLFLLIIHYDFGR